MKKFNVTVICEAVYSGSIEVHDDLSYIEAVEYAKSHIGEIPVDDMEWISDIEIDTENCDFEDD